MRAWVAASVLADCLLLLHHAAQCAAAVRVNTWSACSLDAASDGFSSLSAQCATAVVPLCAGGICTDVDAQTINLYLKRIPATSTGVKTVRNLWVVPDRSDYVPASQVDTQMQMLFRQLGGDVSVYTLDQRGTGRSSQITCDTSVTADTTTVQRCSEALNVVLGDNLVAFSITSAAYDLVSLITLLHAKTEVFLYGLGYGTLIVERLLHFGLADVKGYILDGSATTSGAKKSAFAYISQADEAFGLIGDDFLALCEKDSTCSAKFQDKPVTEVLSNLITSLDDTSVTDDSNCASVFQVTTITTTSTTSSSKAAASSSSDPASYKLRRALAMLMQNVTERAFIPVLLYRLNRCSDVDKPVVKSLLTRLLQREADLKAKKEVVYDLIAFSELWESPSAMEKRLSARFTEASISSGRIYNQLLRYCLFTGDTSTACTELGVNNTTTTNSTKLVYARDAYWNTEATIPATSSVLLLSGNFDGQSPPQYAQDLEDALIGTAKELLNFKAGTHNVLTSSTLDDGTSCGLAILESYVTNSGNINKYDTSCIDKLPSLSFTLNRASSLAVLNTTDAYEGALVSSSTPSSSSSSSNSGNISTSAPSNAGSGSSSSSLEKENESLRQVIRRYRVAFIVIAAMLVVMLVVFAVILLRWWREKQYRDEQRHEQLLRGDDINDDESMRKLHMAATITPYQSLSSEGRDWNASSIDIQPQSSDSMDWNFRSNPRNGVGAMIGDDGDSGEFGHPIAPPPFSDWTYSSSNHLRM